MEEPLQLLVLLKEPRKRSFGEGLQLLDHPHAMANLKEGTTQPKEQARTGMAMKSKQEHPRQEGKEQPLDEDADHADDVFHTQKISNYRGGYKEKSDLTEVFGQGVDSLKRGKSYERHCP